MKLIVLCVACFGLNSLVAQVTIVKDERIDQLVKGQGQNPGNTSAPQLQGYRLQITFDADKAVVDEARTKFNALFPKVDTYVEFVAPHYFLKVGDFRTQFEAEGVKAQIQAQFPLSFVVKEKINLPRIDQ
jgi:hypothetical protein